MTDELTLLEKARVKAHDYADKNLDPFRLQRRDEGMSLHAMLKNAYQQGFLDGFKLKLTGDSE